MAVDGESDCIGNDGTSLSMGCDEADELGFKDAGDVDCSGNLVEMISMARGGPHGADVICGKDDVVEVDDVLVGRPRFVNPV
jgi:hypothetical protein